MAPLFAFDLGDTLVEYAGLPLSWEEHYPAALAALARHCGFAATRDFLSSGIDVLRRHNTRLIPRVHEVAFRDILVELIAARAAPTELNEIECARAFFAPFRQRLRCMPETGVALRTLRARGARIAVLTDVPYGMPRSLVEEDVQESGISDAIDLLATSRDVGFRKPDRRTLDYLMSRMNTEPGATVYVGNERKDVEAALASGCEAVLFDPRRQMPAWGQHRTIARLTEL
jgi:putative hydrolase of the HAD superfamily